MSPGFYDTYINQFIVWFLLWKKKSPCAEYLRMNDMYTEILYFNDGSNSCVKLFTSISYFSVWTSSLNRSRVIIIVVSCYSCKYHKLVYSKGNSAYRWLVASCIDRQQRKIHACKALISYMQPPMTLYQQKYMIKSDTQLWQTGCACPRTYWQEIIKSTLFNKIATITRVDSVIQYQLWWKSIQMMEAKYKSWSYFEWVYICASSLHAISRHVYTAYKEIQLFQLLLFLFKIKTLFEETFTLVKHLSNG